MGPCGVVALTFSVHGSVPLQICCHPVPDEVNGCGLFVSMAGPLGARGCGCLSVWEVYNLAQEPAACRWALQPWKAEGWALLRTGGPRVRGWASLVPGTWLFSWDPSFLCRPGSPGGPL